MRQVLTAVAGPRPANWPSFTDEIFPANDLSNSPYLRQMFADIYGPTIQAYGRVPGSVTVGVAAPSPSCDAAPKPRDDRRHVR